MVVVSLLPHAEIGPNEQREDSFHFSQNQASVILFVNELGVLPRIRVRNHEKFVHEITIKSQSCTKSRLNLNRARLANKMHEESCTKDDWILSTISNPALNGLKDRRFWIVLFTVNFGSSHSPSTLGRIHFGLSH